MNKSKSLLKKEKVTIIALSNMYTRKVYNAIRISSISGNYPFSFNEETQNKD